MNAADIVRPLCLLVFAGALLLAAASDVRRYLIPNRFSLAILAAYVPFALTGPLVGALTGAFTAFMAFVIGLFFFSRGWLGGGDVKLIVASTLWAGPLHVGDFLLATTLAGAALAGLYLTPVRHYLPAAPIPAPGPASAASVPGEPRRLQQPIPFAVAIAIGGLLTAVHLAH